MGHRRRDLVRRESPARRREQTVRRKMADELGPVGCHLKIFNVCTGPAEAFHELVGARQGGSRIDRRNLAPSCNRCNSWVEDNPEIARRYLWKVPRHEAMEGDGGLIPANPNPHAMDGGWDG